ncbi:SWIM zinc finger family protein [Rubrobacter calidifluminis]|uniref:SWIM zinc finger family protein n=1 Tax=Rubrobacter calidifluminis TaxID=1392640 RepID=UPI0023617846|nr:SWIM zinc finger family protein [Rubrobacter calidifluminis]
MKSIAEERAQVQVPSFTNGGEYVVNLDAGKCTCPAYRYRGGECKHLRLARAASRAGLDISGASRGILADGRRVVVVDSMVHDYQPRTSSQRFQSQIWGWGWGTWQHSLCFDGRRWLRESTRIDVGESRVVEVDPENWLEDLPVHCMAGAA